MTTYASWSSRRKRTALCAGRRRARVWSRSSARASASSKRASRRSRRRCARCTSSDRSGQVQVFRYKALSPDGSLVQGEMQAARSEDVRAALLARDMRVSTVVVSGKRWYDFFKLEQKAKPREMVLFCRQLASFVAVGVPVTNAMRTFAEEAHTRQLRDAYLAVVADLERG